MSDGRVRVVMPRKTFYRLTGFLGEALEVLWRKRNEFPSRVGLTYQEARSLSDERLIIRYGLLGDERPFDRRTGRPYGPTKPRKTGTAWDALPKMKAEILPGERLSLVLARGELAIFANCVDVALEELAPTRSVGGENEFHSRIGISTREAEAFRDELRRLDRETRVQRSS